MPAVVYLMSCSEVCDSRWSIISKPNRSVVATFFQDNIPTEVISAQAEVVRRCLPNGCDFAQLLVNDHATGLDDFIKDSKYDVYVIFDIDCIPLANWVVPWLLQNALAGTVVGAAQRANHIDNNEHIYAGPCALAFSREVFERVNGPSFIATDRGDVAEELTYACESHGIPICLLWPTHVVHPKWPLRGGFSFGNGTTFGAAVYHAFELSRGQTVTMFIERCKQVLAGMDKEFECKPNPH
jgi:hypothetical protein